MSQIRQGNVSYYINAIMNHGKWIPDIKQREGINI